MICAFRNFLASLVVTTVGVTAIVPISAVAQDVDPREFGIDLPPGPISPGNDEPIETTDFAGKTVVAKTYVRIGNDRVVMLPDGELVARRADDVKTTTEKFEPATIDDLVERFTKGPLRGMGLRAKRSKHYVYLYNTSESFQKATSGILETMIPGMLNHAKQQKIEAAEPELPLIAIMFRTKEQFDAFRPMPDGVVAYYHTLSNQIVMYEESSLWKVKPQLAIQQTISTIAHEGAHQILHNIGVQKRLSRWPMWISEGLAEYYSPTSFSKNLRWKGAGQVNDLRMFELELYLKGRGAATPDGEMIQQTVMAARLTSTGYASAWSLTHYLARNEREAFHRYLREISKLSAFQGETDIVPPGVIPANLELFRDHFGQDLTTIESRLVKHLKSLDYSDPFGEWPHFVATIEIAEGRRIRREANLFHSPEMARRWLMDMVEGLPQEQRQQTRRNVGEFPNRSHAERFARQFLANVR